MRAKCSSYFPFARRGDCRWSALGSGAIYFDASAWLQAILPGRDHLITCCYSVVDDGDAVADLADFEGARFHRTVRLYNIGVVAVRPTLQRAWRHGHHIRRSAREQANVEKLARPQGAILVGESPLETHRAGGLGDLVVENRHGALGQLSVVVTAHRVGANGTRFQRRLDGSELTLRQSEDD